MFVNDLILNACVKTTHIFVSEKILATFGNKCINISGKQMVSSNQIKKFYLKSVHFITVQHKLSRAFQTDIVMGAINVGIYFVF
jgi:hypothetical protein